MPRPLQSLCPSCDEAFGPEQIGQPCPYCDEPLRDAEDVHQERWEHQQEAWAADPPISLDERHHLAWLEKQRAKGRFV